MTTTETLANAQQADHWAIAGKAWVEHNAVMERFMAPLTAALLDAAFPGEGRAVVDIGCGVGATTRQMARRLGPAGRAVGVDISEPMVAAAQRQAQAEGLAGAEFRQADAQTADLGEAAFDAAMSRFGVMFFADPVAAFGNIRRAVKPGGQISFICWRSPAENAFFVAPSMAAAAVLPPSAPPDPDAPGPFFFADPQRVHAVLEGAGWRDLAIDKVDVPRSMSPAEALTMTLGVGPVASAARENPELRPRLEEAVRQAFEPFRQGEALAVSLACWLVRARA
jgi:SAM-dependent methyltransferase